MAGLRKEFLCYAIVLNHKNIPEANIFLLMSRDINIKPCALI